ncbi:hypothetical protein KK062_22280 [Fulvivirgaceae bacterium PWU5]|uniref:Peptidase S74 domain-containing protein n=1 Tax=Dawidia cretensis TaxID=2782350 RepID=A0AAP2E3D6_9BACT|nr:hypothetical protein [Dawidia cretensis]MBT1710987.1 hypothetical protein [Dawidia cretensis]
MKKETLLIVAMIVLNFAGFAQTLYVPGGTGGIATTSTTNVGIGVASPTEKLSVQGNVTIPFSNWYGVSPSTSKFIYKGANVSDYGLGWLYDSWNTSPSAYWSAYGGIKIFTAQLPRLVVSNGGNVGVGLEAPTQRLDVNGNVQVPIDNLFGFGLSDKFTYNGKNPGNYSLSWVFDSWSGSPTSYLSSYGGLKIFTSGLPRLAVHENGNVAIGTTDSKGYKLAVAGKIVAEEVVVKLQANWPDYVFDASYQVPSLSDVEAYIRVNRHLPGIPAAAEVQEKGIPVGDMSAALLKKVEELTLYMIEANKKIESLQRQVDSINEHK